MVIGVQRILIQELAIGGDGPKVVVKDTIDVAGFPTRLGSRAFENIPPARRHAAVVQALLDGGCRLVGKANMHELAYGVTGINAWTGTPLNPLFSDLAPGGSSSGSAAAVAAGLCDFALGTDTGGSIRVPAACCGVYGFKPSFGRIGRAGVIPFETSLDCVGPLARDMAGIERAMGLIDPRYRRLETVGDPIIGVVDVKVDMAVRIKVSAAISRLELAKTSVHLTQFEDAFEAGLTIIGAETWAAFDRLDLNMVGADVRNRLRTAADISTDQVRYAEQVRAAFTAEVDRALEAVDVLILPTLPILPPTLVEAEDARAAIRITALVRPFNLSGHPALSIPLPSLSKRPVSLQLVGRRDGDARLCAFARRIVHALNIQSPEPAGT